MSASESPLVSIGMPVFNCEKTVGIAIRSILNQTYVNWELIVLDDGSRDSTVEIARGFHDARIRVIADGRRKTLAPRLNEAVSLSRGKYFARMDGDDVSFPRRLELQVAYMERNPDTDLLGAGLVVFRGEGEVLGTRATGSTHEEICRRPCSGFPLAHPTWIGKTVWFCKHPYRPDAVRCEDQDLLLRAYEQSRLAALDEILLGYREEELSLRRILSSRLHFVRSVTRTAIEKRRYGMAVAAAFEHSGKAVVDVLAISTGLGYAILRHRALPTGEDIGIRWAQVWETVNANEEKRAPNRFLPAAAGWRRPGPLGSLSRSVTPPNLTMRSNLKSMVSPPMGESRRASPRILRAATSAMSLSLMRGQFECLRDSGYDVFVLASPGPELDGARMNEKVATIALPIKREIACWRDLIGLYKLWRITRRLRPQLVDSATPKAGLLCGLAAWAARVPCRVHSLWGLRSETLAGPKRWVVWFTEVIACRSAHRVICVSESLRRKALDLGIVNEDRAVVLGSGSSNGVDAERFTPNEDALRRAADLRKRLRIPPDALVLGFVGRFTRDKGVPELLDAYYCLRRDISELKLLLVGAPEEGDCLPQSTLDAISHDPQIICPGFVDDAADYYHVMDVLALPTHREGFPNVVLEAHAAGKPVVAAKATGVVDAVVDGVNGLLVPIGNSAALAKALRRLLKDKPLAASMGRAGRERVFREFQQERIWSAMLREYASLLREKGLRAPEESALRPLANSVSHDEAVGS